jgi:two-component system, LytTR family, response regulator
MRAILVDDEAIMLRSFMRNSAGIPQLNVVAQFQSAEEAIAYAEENVFELALLDVCLPGMDGIELAVRLRELYPSLLVVFISAFDEYIRNFNEIGGDYYIVKPYKKETIQMMVEKMSMLVERLNKEFYIQMFGRFNVLKNGTPLKLSGKTKEIFALIASRRGREISNEEIYSTVWENREYSNESMKVYYNALSRLRRILADAGASDLLLSTTHGQMLNTALCDCDYFAWQDESMQGRDRFEGEFLSEYSWGEAILAGILNKNAI